MTKLFARIFLCIDVQYCLFYVQRSKLTQAALGIDCTS